MRILGYNISRKAVNAEPTQKKRKNNRKSDEVKTPRVDIIKMQMNTLRDAVESALDPEYPNYSDLYSIYENTVKDSEVITQMQNATDKLEAEPFAVAIDGVDDDELTKLFKKSWFTDFLWCCFEYDLWGYTVAEAGPFLDNGLFKSFSTFSRKNILPNRLEILVNDYDTRGFPYADKATELFFVELGKPRELGMLETLSRIVIWKSFSEADWSRYNEKVGIPSLMIGTDADGADLTNIETAAKNFGTNSYFVGDIDVANTKLLEASGAGNTYKTFEAHIDRMEKQIAKIINGQTATSETQAFVGSAQVQAQTYVDKHASRLRRYSNIINDQLFPFLRFHGYPLPDNAEFRFTALDNVDATPIEADEQPTDPDTTQPTTPTNRMVAKKKSVVANEFIDRWLKRFFAGVSGVDPQMWLYNFKEILAATKDAGISYKTTYKYADLAEQLRTNAAVFAAFKNHDEQQRLIDLLVDENGEPRSLSAFIKAARPIAEEYNIEYLKTEFNQARINAQMAVKWEGFKENADIYPNLKYVAVGDKDTRPDHAELDGIVRPIKDKFWDNNYPPNGWNCRCDVVQTDEKVTPVKTFDPEPGFDGNPGKDGKLFTDTNGYQQRATDEQSKAVQADAEMLLKDFLNDN